jgi:acyl carrier protein
LGYWRVINAAEGRAFNMLLQILQGLYPEIDFTAHRTLIDSRVIDSYDMIYLVGEIADKMGVQIPVEELTPENFNSYEALNALAERLKSNL